MNRVAKLITALQALLLAPLGVAKPGEAAPPSDLSETAAWQSALSNGSPEALQHYISQFPQGERLGEAFGLIVDGEVEAAKSDALSAARAIQLSEAAMEVLEHNFEGGLGRKPENQDDRGVTPY